MHFSYQEAQWYSNSMLYFIAFAAFLATLLGGLFALRLKDRLHLVLGFSAGAIIGVAFFDLLPEAIELGGGLAPTFIGLGFVVYMLLDRFVGFHCQDEHDHSHSHSGTLGAGSLSIHSFFDGIAVGLAFQVSTEVGIVVTTAVLLHDFSDGINTINMILKNGGEKKTAFKWLLVDAVAPVLGILTASFFTLPQETLGLLLAVFCGFFLYIGASDLLPESHHNHPRALTTVMTVIGMGVMYAAIQLAGI